jgi:ParB-like chromosome segregation protein Spo0J
MKPTLTTERVATDALRPYQHNPRNGDTDAIVESLRANGQFRPLVVSEDGVVLAGNHTLYAAMELGWTEIDIVRLPVHSETNEAAKIVLADNRTSDRARYDDGLLLQLLGSLDDDLYGTAFTSTDVSDLLALAADPPDLADLAAGWSSNGAAVPAASIRLNDPATIAAWREARDEAMSDDEAFRAIAGLE